MEMSGFVYRFYVRAEALKIFLNCKTESSVILRSLISQEYTESHLNINT